MRPRSPRIGSAGVTGLLSCLLLALAGACGGGSDSDQLPDEPHALGVVALGESHASTGGTSSASLGVQFTPDAASLGTACTREVAGCTLPLIPECTGCGESEFCSFDTSCQPTCKRVCDASCSSDEECYFPTPDSPACRTRERFDAGTITLSGTTTPVTLFPPYNFEGVNEGSLFLDGNMITVTATGTATAGYPPFEFSFPATQLIRTSPPLHELGLTDVFGTGDVPVRWVAGEDKIVITASVRGTEGQFSTVTCEADDTTGAFDLPRAAIDAALDGGALDSMTMTVMRRRFTTKTGISTQGSLTGTLMQPTGWLELSTQSVESASFEGCGGGEQVCGDECVDTRFDPSNCGSCGNSCGSESCNQGVCSGATSCNSCVEEASSGSCASATQACTNNAACASLRTCIGNCGTQDCVQTCFEENPDGQSDYSNWANCICSTGCPLECADACGG